MLVEGGRSFILAYICGLRVVRLVPLIVPVPPEANHVDYDVFCKLRPVIQGQFHHVERSFRTFAVYMKDRHHQHLRYIGGIAGGAGVLRECGKTDLVINNYVQGPACGIALQLGHVEGFGHNSLARKGGIPMDQNGQHPFAGHCLRTAPAWRMPNPQ